MDFLLQRKMVNILNMVDNQIWKFDSRVGLSCGLMSYWSSLFQNIK